jgi:hypothetical protein
MKKKRASFKARHAKNIKKGKTSAAYWASAWLTKEYKKRGGKYSGTTANKVKKA